MTIRSNYDLMQMHVHALYIHDSRSRIVSVNDWNGGSVPRFFLGRTMQGNVWRFRQDLPEGICKELESFFEAEPFSLSEQPRFESEYVRILSEHAPVESKWFGYAFWFPKHAETPSEPVSIDTNNSYLLKESMPDWLLDVPHQQPFVARVVSGQAVAVCASVRITDAAHEAGVETLEIHRRKGYAVSVVRSWASAVEERGAIPLYSTSFNNIGSQNVAARLGLSRYGVDFDIS